MSSPSTTRGCRVFMEIENAPTSSKLHTGQSLWAKMIQLFMLIKIQTNETIRSLGESVDSLRACTRQPQMRKTTLHWIMNTQSRVQMSVRLTLRMEICQNKTHKLCIKRSERVTCYDLFNRKQQELQQPHPTFNTFRGETLSDVLWNNLWSMGCESKNCSALQKHNWKSD